MPKLMHECSIEEIEDIFSRATFVFDLGVRVTDIEAGQCSTILAVEPRHLQQNGFIHAGVQATMADHTCGGAAATLLSVGSGVLTSEFKINLLRPAKGDQLQCRATVIKPGKRLSIVEADVFCLDGEKTTHTARVLATIVPIPKDEMA